MLLFVGIVRSKILTDSCFFKRAAFFASSFSDSVTNFAILSTVSFLELRSDKILFLIGSSDI